MEKDIKKYFTRNAKDWIQEAYFSDGYTYPVGAHRLRIVLKILSQNFPSKNARLLDVGCGGGNLCCEVAKQGYCADGIDRSAVMIDWAKQQAARLPKQASGRVKFYLKEFNDIGLIPPRQYDFITALGLIGYLPDEQKFLKELKRLLKPGGLLVFSCRNRLFNMFPGSKYMRHEIKQGTALGLLDEIDALYQRVDDLKARIFSAALKKIAGEFTVNTNLRQSIKNNTDDKFKKFSEELNPRQHTPNQIIGLAKKTGLKIKGFYGVHPHLLSPKMNKLLPKGMFNAFSDTLCEFESSPLSLTWSSVFLVLLQKPLK